MARGRAKLPEAVDSSLPSPRTEHSGQSGIDRSRSGQFGLNIGVSTSTNLIRVFTGIGSLAIWQGLYRHIFQPSRSRRPDSAVRPGGRTRLVPLGIKASCGVVKLQKILYCSTEGDVRKPCPTAHTSLVSSDTNNGSICGNNGSLVIADRWA
ncbi:hypothetical protein Bbelb_423940 [Branchiostoma belcheri]|nr:hypothetical protein Bbelb_423940 [Branchiostoma belcheri]